MSLKNYSTSINVDKTISEIERILSTHGASDIWKQYDGTGNVVCLNSLLILSSERCLLDYLWMNGWVLCKQHIEKVIKDGKNKT